MHFLDLEAGGLWKLWKAPLGALRACGGSRGARPGSVEALEGFALRKGPGLGLPLEPLEGLAPREGPRLGVRLRARTPLYKEE